MFYKVILRNLLVLFLLTIVGILAHYKSLGLSLYGDDWMQIYNFYAYPNSNGALLHLPGFLKYLTPYGFSLFLIGNLHQIFGTQYYLYYIVAFIFRLFAAFVLYNICKYLGDRRIGLLTAILFIVGQTGIQNTDWVFSMNIYLATGLFLLGLYFQILFYKCFHTKFLLLSLLCICLSIIAGTIRLFPLVFIIPFFNAFIYFKIPKNIKTIKIILQTILFFLFVIVLWGIGLFGGSAFTLYPFGGWSLDKFINLFLENPLIMIKTLFIWYGMIILPDQVTSNKLILATVGITVNIIITRNMIKGFKNSEQQKWLLLFSLQFLFFTMMTWYFLPSTVIDSSHRYLFLAFTTFCLWLFATMHKSKITSYVMITLIIIHFLGLRQTYNSLLDSGRASNYTRMVELQFSKDFSNLSRDTLVYLASDDERLKFSIVFGLGYKVLVLNKKWDTNYLINPYLSRIELLNGIKSRQKAGGSLDKIILRTYAYKVDHNSILDITDLVRQDIKKELAINNY